MPGPGDGGPVPALYTAAMEHLSGFAPLASRYDGFILDLWGVIHDGVRPYPGAAECLEGLRRLGRPVVLLSNAPRRAAAAAAMLRQMGIADDLYTSLVTSGEVTHEILRDRGPSWARGLGRRVLHLGPERDRNLLDGLDLAETVDPEAAEFVLNTGPDDQNPTDLAAFEPLLAAAAARALPMLCANPDLEVIRGGQRVLCAGALAERYAAYGGTVHAIGKPDPAIYRPVLARLGLPRQRVLAVGDSLRTDIAGAAAAGIAACWVLGGLHGALAADPGAAEAAAAAAALHPVATLPAFVW